MHGRVPANRFPKVENSNSFTTFVRVLLKRTLIWNQQSKQNSIMAYKIAEDVCVACGTCIGECPVGAISEGEVYKIDADACLGCGTCAGVCPTGAISEA